MHFHSQDRNCLNSISNLVSNLENLLDTFVPIVIRNRIFSAIFYNLKSNGFTGTAVGVKNEFIFGAEETWNAAAETNRFYNDTKDTPKVIKTEKIDIDLNANVSTSEWITYNLVSSLVKKEIKTEKIDFGSEGDLLAGKWVPHNSVNSFFGRDVKILEEEKYKKGGKLVQMLVPIENQKDSEYDTKRCQSVTEHKDASLHHDEYDSNVRVSSSVPMQDSYSATTSKFELRENSETVHVHECLFPCEHCSAKFKTKQDVYIHSQVHSSEQYRTCKYCSYIFKTKYGLKSHLAGPPNGRQFSCQQCTATFKAKCELRLHLTVHHNEKKYSCVCGAKFKTKDSLKRHMFVHSSERPFSCSVCDATFRCKRGLTSHSKVHSKVPLSKSPLSCMHCDAVFKSKISLRQHSFLHSSRLLYSCLHCNGTFKSKDELIKHSTVHSSRSFTCLHCDAAFETKDELVKHASVHSSKPSWRAPSPTVSTQKNSLSSSSAHRVFDCFSKPFSCAFCTATFETKYEFKRHSYLSKCWLL